VKGLVTTPTVRMPSERATSAITGAAPVPVPPPMPAVMNTMCAPRPLPRYGRVGDRHRARLFRLRAGARPLKPSWIWLPALLRESNLRIGVDRDELHPLDGLLDHVIERRCRPRRPRRSPLMTGPVT